MKPTRPPIRALSHLWGMGFNGLSVSLRHGAAMKKSVSLSDLVSRAFLGALALFNLTLVFSVMVIGALGASSLAAKAQTTPACTGQNLLDVMAQTDPDGYQRVLDAAADTVFGDHIFYRVERPGTAPSYLFGTMHMTDERVLAMPDAAANALTNADIVAIEATEILDETKAQMALLGRPDLTMFTGDERLDDFMTEQQKAVIEAGLEQKGMKLALVNRMKPWLLSGMLALPACETARKQGGAKILDVFIAEQAQQGGKELVGLETIIEQLEAMDSIAMADHIAGLADTLKFVDYMDDVIETMIIAYDAGDIGIVWPLLQNFKPDGFETDAKAANGYASFEEIMVNKRNQTMFDRSLPLLERGNAFIAVGALHLPGQNGLAQMYTDAGYTVTPM